MLNKLLTNLNDVYFYGLTLGRCLLLYMAPGALYMSYHLLKGLRERPSQFARNVINIVCQKRGFGDIAMGTLVYAIAVPCALIGWPILLIFSYRQYKSDAQQKIIDSKPSFDCAPEYLIAKVSIVQAENAHYVTDPLGKVPNVPFGHLHSGWKKFIADLSQSDELWSFDIPVGSKCGRYGILSTSQTRGYAKLRGGDIIGEWIFEGD